MVSSPHPTRNARWHLWPAGLQPNAARNALRRATYNSTVSVSSRSQRVHSDLQPLEPVLVVLGLPDPLAAEGEWRLKAHTQLLSQIFGLRLPWSTPGTKTRPHRVWGLCPCSSGGGNCRTAGHAVPPCRGQEPGHPQSLTRGLGGSDRVFKQSGQPLPGGHLGQRPGTSGRLGINGLLLVVVTGDGKLGVSVDCSEARSNLSRCPISSRHAAACSQTHVRTFATGGSTDSIGSCSRCAGILRLRARPNKRASGITTGNWS